MFKGSSTIDKAVKNLLNATESAVSGKGKTQAGSVSSQVALLTSANRAIGKMFEQQPVDIIRMTDCVLDFSTHVEQVVLQLSGTQGLKPKGVLNKFRN